MRKHGYGATGLQEILDAAGVPKGSFYHHFGSKEAFTAAVSSATSRSKQTRARGPRQTRQAPLKRLRRYFEELIRRPASRLRSRAASSGALAWRSHEASPVLQSCLSFNFTQWQAGVASVLREAVETGELPKSTEA